MNKQEAFAKLDMWCTLCAKMLRDTEEKVVEDMRNSGHLAKMCEQLSIDPIHAMEWVVNRRAAKKKEVIEITILPSKSRAN